ncbi:TonB-dependent siderophore receptor [Sphingomonas asaccharolytica]|uniref:TonB-dependent siderophore receptor n=1 Tax=Sphingomonas asaccharolytica TaxID=40681 RepID=UPI0008328EEC|nr:TonB-dependent receptor [Sphingomonas asaccharolytica]
MKLSRVLMVGTSVLVACVAPTVAFAQSTAAPPASGQSAGDKQDQDSDDIVVTGERNNQIGTDTVQSGSFRNAKVLDVPLTISVIPSALLQSQQAVELIDAIRNTPGVSTTSTGTVAYQNVTIRGITADTRANFRLDGALNVISATAFPLENKDRVEVLKGASALYYGFSSPAGIVNLVMKRPTQELSFGVTMFGDSNQGIGANVDVGDTMGIFGYRINALSAHLDTGIAYASGTRYMASGAFDLKPTDKLTITADVEYFQKDIAEPAFFLLTVPTNATHIKIPDVSILDPKKNISGADWDFNRTHEFNYLGKAVYKFSKDWNLSGYFGQSRMVRFRNNPQFTPTNLTTALDPASATYGAGIVRFSGQQAVFLNTNYALELSGITHLGKFRNEILVGASRTIRANASSANVRVPFAQNFANPVYIPNPNIPYSALPPVSRIDDKGVYVFDRLSFNDVIELLGGIRKSSYKNDGSINNVTKTPYSAKPTSYSAAIMVKPVKWVSVYATYIEGLEETPAAPSTTDNATQIFAPTVSTEYEAGLKVQPVSNLLFQAAYFKIDRGAAYAANLPGTTTLHYFVDGRQVYEGAEFSLTGYVVPDLAVNVAGMVLSAHYRDQPVIAGLRVDGTPKNSWSVSGEYRLSWLDPALKLTGGVYHTGSQAVNANNQAFTDPYTTFDVGGSYTFKLSGHELIARVNGQNITGKRYWASVGASSLAETVPSTVKFSLAFKY